MALRFAEYVIILSHMARSTDDLEEVLRALASPIRRRVLDLLREGPMSTGDIAARFPELSRFAVMQHLGVLEGAALLVPRRDGRTRLNYLNPVPIQRIYQRWVSRYQEPWTEALVSMKDALESETTAKRGRRAR
jgi:DNA-binding transcriptional ArsR family regulator